jgi:hypothetical protein
MRSPVCRASGDSLEKNAPSPVQENADAKPDAKEERAAGENSNGAPLAEPHDDQNDKQVNE